MNLYSEMGLPNWTLFVAQSNDNSSARFAIPSVYDPTLGAVRFLKRGTEETIATLVSWSGHPEAIGRKNNLLSSDYPHYWREGVEKGLPDPHGAAGLGVLAKLGAVEMVGFFQQAVMVMASLIRALTAAGLVRYLHTHRACQIFDGFRKGQVFIIHKKAHRVAVCAATEAVVELFVLVDRE